jgi:hypothetical protein
LNRAAAASSLESEPLRSRDLSRARDFSHARNLSHARSPSHARNLSHARNRSHARTRRLAIAAAVLALAALAWEGSARAAESDGLYGRFDGDVTLHAGAGVAVVSGGAALAARLEALYLSTAGIYGHYTDALGQEGPLVERSIAAGLVMQPLFLARFASDWERGPARLDLFADSLALSIGAFWYTPRGGSLGGDPGLELALAFGLPLFADATGPFIDVRAALRWRPSDLHPSTAQGNIFDRGALLSITLAWHHVMAVHIVDAGDRSPR